MTIMEVPVIKSFKSILILSVFTLCYSLHADISEVSEASIIYGEDNRLETYEVNATQQRLAKSTAGMIKKLKLVGVNDHYMLPPMTIDQEMGLCESERFYKQPSAVICSGFLIGPDLLVTAGHCVTTKEDCEKYSWVFDYKEEEKTKRTNILVPKSKVFHCKELVEAKLVGSRASARDYALIKLDRNVPQREYLKYRTQGSIQVGEDILVIGHPSGLPTKVAADAQVTAINGDYSFVSNLDTFGGNSGSAVFNERTNIVEGILVRGAVDYVKDKENKCIRVNQVDHDIEGKGNLGEAVSKITDIEVLKLRDQLLLATTQGDIKKLKKLYPKLAAKDINYDNNKNTLLHLAIKKRKMAAFKYLLSQKVALDNQNLDLETPLHLAAFYGNFTAAKLLIKVGANPKIKDKFGVYPSKRTPYFAFALRRYLRGAEKGLNQ